MSSYEYDSDYDCEPTSPLADRLAMACWNGDLASVKAAVADGASVNEKGKSPHGWEVHPCAAAVSRQHHDVVVWLLSHGADPNGDKVVYYGAYDSTVAILQLLIDAGGDVNREILGGPPLFVAVDGRNSMDKLRVVLAQPSLDFTLKCDGKPTEQFARGYGWLVQADMMAQEVSGKGLACLSATLRRCGGVAVTGRSRDERRWYAHCFVRLIKHVLCRGHDKAGFGGGVLWQSAEEVCREVEAADAASVARLVRGVSCCGDAAPGTRGCCVFTNHVYVVVVALAWSGGCGAWRAAKSSGAYSTVSLCCCVVPWFPGVVATEHLMGLEAFESGCMPDLCSDVL